MEKITIDWNMLSNISYRTRLGKNLKNTLRKFEKEALFEEINNIIFTLTCYESEVTLEHRIKSLHSCNLKYNKYFPTSEVEKVFNDILGIRIIVDKYSSVDSIILPECVRMVDMRCGKNNDDGYRAIHMYYQKDHFHYPIEIQFMTASDRQFNEWLHIYFYKYVTDNSVGVELRKLYDDKIIVNEEDFRREMHKLCVI